MLDLSSNDKRPRKRVPSGIGLLIAAAASFALWLLIALAAAAIFLA
jgi:hypothetical protein